MRRGDVGLGDDERARGLDWVGRAAGLSASRDRPDLSASLFGLLSDIIHERLGLHYEADKRAILADRLAPLALARGLDSFLDYYQLLRYDQAADAEWRRVSDALAVPETFFWREISAARALVTTILPAWVAAHPGRPLRVWSAACSSGEEPLTIAMLLDEAGWFQRAQVEILASDASERAIERARQGQYADRALRALPPPLRDRYFQGVDGGWRIDSALQARVRWSVTNILDAAAVSDLASAPVIFCRNLFIYFSTRSIRRAARLFWERMPDQGYLVLGAAESLVRVTSDFQLREIGGAFIYQKRPRGGQGEQVPDE